MIYTMLFHSIKVLLRSAVLILVRELDQSFLATWDVLEMKIIYWTAHLVLVHVFVVTLKMLE